MRNRPLIDVDDVDAALREPKGKTIGLCCPGCGKQFLAWSEGRKDEFVTPASHTASAARYV